ncbi:M20/M25/M40 family metallo-hydrolase [Solibacillus sp. FSL R5-0449]|uniref:M20/M25/M40 family metallo-hydrolase n=1 Tax=Solibacillus sp. FSL R5-0449 TaxID=2921639 RepID=UPI0030CB0B06
MFKWKSKEQLRQLLGELVQVQSVSGSQAEKDFPEVVVSKLSELAYFKEYPDHLNRTYLSDGRSFISALVKKTPVTKKTVVLVSHFDVVDVQDYGKWKQYAFDPEKLTEQFYSVKDNLPEAVRVDLDNGNWLFGRGTMDMKCGLALHMSIVEQATYEEYDGNILLLTVPDEEVNSEGMRAAVPQLVQLAEKYNLEYTTILNSEPMFSNFPGDLNNYFYTGSIGKALPGFLCYGKEAHVGEPFGGLNANYMASVITAEMELNMDFCEKVGVETTPPPTNLIYRDLKTEYSTQISHRAVTLFNLFLFERSMTDVVSMLQQKAINAATEIEQSYMSKATKYSQHTEFTPQQLKVKVMTYEEIYDYALEKYGEERVEELLSNCDSEKDDRERTIDLVDQLAALCNELAPMIVIFFAPPFYPAISSGKTRLISNLVNELKEYSHETYNMKFTVQNYFAGISDLSYVGLNNENSSIESLINNMPMWDKGYSLPIDDMKKLNVPVLNIGPVGRDPHKWTERLDADFAFGPLVDLLDLTIAKLFAAHYEVNEQILSS